MSSRKTKKPSVFDRLGPPDEEVNAVVLLKMCEPCSIHCCFYHLCSLGASIINEKARTKKPILTAEEGVCGPFNAARKSN